MRSTIRHALLALGVALTLLVASLAFGGCARTDAKLSSAWPVANAERVVPKPPTPPKWPLTGKPASSDTSIHRRVVSVKVENSIAARPQTALNEADIVYETVTEGGITRFNALFHSRAPSVIGPVRSARLSDLWIVPQYDALFAFSGASKSVNYKIARTDIANLSQDAGVEAPYFRSGQRSAPHNLYLRYAKVFQAAKARGYATNGKVTPSLRFSVSVDSSDTVKSITIPMSDYQTTSWVYRSADKKYVRSDNGRRATDAATGAPVQADNIVVLWARYEPVSRDKFGSTTYDVDLGGEGRATVFRNGRKIDGTWSTDHSAPPLLKTEDGSVIKLAPGTTWFEVLDTKRNIKLK